MRWPPVRCAIFLGEQISVFCKYFEPIGSIFVWKIMRELVAKYGENFRKTCVLIGRKCFAKRACRERASEIFDCEELTA